MGAELADVPADRQPEGEPPVRGPGSAFTLPVSTSLRFALLIAAVAASSFFVYVGIYLATPRGAALISLIARCRSQALARHPAGVIAYASALGHAAVCYSGGERTEAWWGLLGVGVLLVAAGAIFLAQPWWYRRRRHLTELTGAGAGDLVNRLEGVRLRAGTGPVVWLLQPLDARLSAFTFGRPGHRCVAISGGAAIAAVRMPAAFDCVVLHELSHIKNRDIDQAYLALAIWRAFVVAALLPMAVLLIFSNVLGEPQRLIWRAAVMALIVYSLRNAILRSREFDADARVRQLDPETALGAVLAGMPARTGRRVWHLGGTHPSGQERAAALVDPAPLYRFGFWDGLAVGLVAALGASATHEIVTLLTTVFGVRYVVIAIIFAAFAGPAVAVAMWRRQLVEADTGVVTGWAGGLGLGLGLALGPVIALEAYGAALWPDHPSLAAFGVLAVWTGLVVLIFTPFPVWVGHWADAWQQGAYPVAPRVPARGAMMAAAAAAWIVMVIGLYFTLSNFALIDGATSAAAEWHQLPGLLRATVLVITEPAAGWVVFLLVAGMPLAAAVVHRRWPWPGDGRQATAGRRRWVAPVLLGLAGCLTAAALMVAVSAIAHARIAEAVRWSPNFLVGLYSFDEQAIVVIAAACAVIVAARARSAVGVALSVVAGAAVAAVSGLALPEVRSMDHCFGSLSIQYAHPPAGACLTALDTLALRQVVLGAALVSIVLVPASYAAATLLRRRLRRPGRPALVWALGWLVAAVSAAAAVTGTVLWEPSASARGIQPAGSIGRDGWIRGPGYHVRLIPNWYASAGSASSGPLVFTFPADGGRIHLQSLAGVNPVKLAEYRSYLIRLGARRGLLDGAPGLLLARSGLPDGVLEQWTIVRGPLVYLLSVDRAPAWPQDSPYLQNAFNYMLRSWQWTG